MVSQFFSSDYFEARRKFLAAAEQAGAEVQTYQNNHATGPDGEPLFTDVALLGSADAAKTIVLVSGTHGNEGFCGSGCQVGFLSEQSFGNRFAHWSEDVNVLLIHAINPYGFANVRRVNEDNVDLNRNFVDHNDTYPENAAYAEIHDFLVPGEWTPAALKEANRGLARYRDEHGAKALQNAVSGGQHSHAGGVFFAGTTPTWSNTTLRAIVQTYLANKEHVALIDFHTGLGPEGYGELILNGDFEHSYARAQSWYNNEVTSFQDGSSSSASLTGMMCNAFLDVLGAARLTGIAGEYGTVPSAEVLLAMRFDNWIHRFEQPGTERWAEGKKAIRDALYCDTDEWKVKIWARAQWVLDKAYQGLASA